MVKKKSPSEKVIRNRRAKFDYELGDNFVVGIVLNGRETKALRLGHGQLQGAYVTVKEGELYLINATIHGTKNIPIEEHEATQARKLLAKRKEISEIIAAKQQGRTIVPTEILTKGRFIKVRIALGKGKKHYDKRETMKRRDDSRNTARELRKSWR
jgi:SsrA-binding protein